jgi:Tol biopolymer transport system component
LLGVLWGCMALGRRAALIWSLAVFAVWTVPAEATFPGRNGRIVFSLQAYSSDQETGVISSERLIAVGRTGRRLPLHVCPIRMNVAGACHEDDPAFSPEGKRLLFTRGVEDPDAYDTSLETASLIAARPNGSAQRSLATPSFETGAFSPDGRWLLHGGEDGMAIHSSRGGPRRQLNRIGRSFLPDWSSRGEIAFVRHYRSRRLPDGIGLDIFTVRPNGRRLRRLTRDANSLLPSWSPDGRRIAFQRFPPGGGREVWVMDADGTHKRRIARGGGPTWSPDGRLVAFGRGASYERGIGARLYVARPDGTGQRWLFTAPEPSPEFSIGRIAWRPLPRSHRVLARHSRERR